MKVRKKALSDTSHNEFNISLLGETINICRTTSEVHSSELEYRINWQLRDNNGFESTEIKCDAQVALESAVAEMKRVSEAAEVAGGKP